MDGNMNLELVKTVISQVGNVVGILLVAELAVWQVKKELVNKRNDEVNEKSFELCCELFELVNHNENYNEEVTDKIEKIVNERNDSKKLLHPEILRIVIKIEEYEKIRSKTELKIKETEKMKKDEKAEVTEEAKEAKKAKQTEKAKKKQVKDKNKACKQNIKMQDKVKDCLNKDYKKLRLYIFNEDDRLRKALGYPRDTLYSFQVWKYGPAAFFSLAEHIAEIVLILFFGLLVCFIMVSKFSAFAVYLAMALCAATIWGIIGIRYVWDKSKFSFSHWINEKKSEIEKEEMMSNAIKSDAENES